MFGDPRRRGLWRRVAGLPPRPEGHHEGRAPSRPGPLADRPRELNAAGADDPIDAEILDNEPDGRKFAARIASGRAMPTPIRRAGRAGRRCRRVPGRSRLRSPWLNRRRCAAQHVGCQRFRRAGHHEAIAGQIRAARSNDGQISRANRLVNSKFIAPVRVPTISRLASCPRIQLGKLQLPVAADRMPTRSSSCRVSASRKNTAGV